MFDFSHLPETAKLGQFIIKSALDRHVWNKPPNANFVFVLLIGGGGGGAGGAAGLAGSSRSGGGGGGSGALSMAVSPAETFPSSIFIYSLSSSDGGAGGSSGTSGQRGISIGIMQTTFGGPTYVGSDHATIQLASGGNGGITGSFGSGAFAQDPASFNFGFFAFLSRGRSGRNGTGVTNGLPANTSIGTASPILGGSGGGGVLTGTPTVFNGAGFTSEVPAILPSIDGGLASSGLDASSGVRLPFVSVGGTGGGANNNGPGGRGGNGVGYGAGGGGGGAGVTGQGGRGGDGGPAYACIIAW